MDSILPSYRDPLFSIMLIITLSLMIAVLTYIWGIYQQQKEKSTLQKFLEKFDSAECALDTSSMPFDIAMFKPLALLAKAFENSGEYHKAINIYLYLIRHTSNPIDKNGLLERLGQTYLHAGFLERSRTIFSEILHKQPRSPDILYKLGIVYEMMNEHDKALEVVEPLSSQGGETRELKRFLEFEKVSSNKQMSPQEKVYVLLGMLKSEEALYRPILTLLFKLDTPIAWKQIDKKSLHIILDVLWFLPYSQLDLDIISQDTNLSAIYYAKGHLKKAPVKCGIFSIDMLVSARISGFEDGDLLFSYLCKKCKQSFPVSFTRCPNCLALNSIEVEENIVKQHKQTNYSLL